MRNIEAIAFDAYGTLYDVHSVVAATEAAFGEAGSRLSDLWRAKQLEYTWLRSLMDRYEPFSTVTRNALRYAARALDLDLAPAVEDRLMGAYLDLDPFPDAVEALRALRPRRLWIFSNGDPLLLEPLVRNSGLDALLDGIISVDPARVFKPSPRAYARVPEALALPPDRILFVSSNPFDVAGATVFGFPTAWVRRSARAFDELGVTPALTVERLTDLVDPATVAAWPG
jgi:2-haloacid dehalogenase